ncbi:hypothetical protein E5163_04180 [Marinicauda algicola]|uniref:Uncharacterized protein n=1 Tax=Marinicauda algicola TaxID=2029849 RepID=A0A4S2H4V0_9PROT|nr:hypothetical protein [Marinicauda algicola]TGY90332.1 hypothetical protein E5163_04180 [Marinicauda algicola]
MRAFSLPDWAFYPLAGLLAAGLVALAMLVRPAGTEPVVQGGRFTVQGPALSNFIPGPGTRVSFMPDYPGGAVARAGSDASLEAAGALSAGVGLVVPPAFEAAVVGQPIRVTFEIQAMDDTLEEVRIGYFTVSTGDSGWRAVPVSERFETVSFDWQVPADAALNENEWVGIWPDPEGLGRDVLVRRVVIEILAGQGSSPGGAGPARRAAGAAPPRE